MHRDDRNDGETTSLSDTFSEKQVQLSNDREDFSGTKWRGQVLKHQASFSDWYHEHIVGSREFHISA